MMFYLVGGLVIEMVKSNLLCWKKGTLRFELYLHDYGGNEIVVRLMNKTIKCLIIYPLLFFKLWLKIPLGLHSKKSNTHFLINITRFFMFANIQKPKISTDNKKKPSSIHLVEAKNLASSKLACGFPKQQNIITST